MVNYQEAEFWMALIALIFSSISIVYLILTYKFRSKADWTIERNGNELSITNNGNGNAKEVSVIVNIGGTKHPRELKDFPSKESDKIVVPINNQPYFVILKYKDHLNIKKTKRFGKRKILD